jgi:hypothetical protein
MWLSVWTIMVENPTQVSRQAGAPYNFAVARPMPTDPLPGEDVPAPPDPDAIELRYRYHRARRNARVRQKQESRLARYRFYIVMLVLIALAVAFVIGSWHEIQRLFGL